MYVKWLHLKTTPRVSFYVPVYNYSINIYVVLWHFLSVPYRWCRALRCTGFIESKSVTCVWIAKIGHNNHVVPVDNVTRTLTHGASARLFLSQYTYYLKLLGGRGWWKCRKSEKKVLLHYTYFPHILLVRNLIIQLGRTILAEKLTSLGSVKLFCTVRTLLCFFFTMRYI